MAFNLIKSVPSSLRKSMEGQSGWSDEPFAADGPVAYSHVEPPAATVNAMLSRMQTLLESRRDVIGKAFDEYGYTGFANPNGEIPPKPKDIISKFDVPRQKVSNGNYPQLVKAGVIVVAPYQSKGSITVKAVAGLKEISSSADWDYPMSANLAGSAGFTVVSPNRWYFSPNRFISPSYVIARCKTRKYRQDWLMPTFYSAEEVFKRLSESWTPDPGLVTKVWADNNTKRLDFLTALAEMPKTISSALDAIGYLGTLVRNLKNRRIFLTKMHQREFNRLGMSFNERRKQINAAFDRKIARARSPAVILRLQARRDKSIRSLEAMRKREARKMIREFNTTLASLWLSFRYEIMPLVYTAEDILDVIASSTSDFITSRNREPVTKAFSIPSDWYLDKSVAEFSPTHKVMVKSKLSPDNNLGKTMSTNPFTTAWELLTLSFVVDWFINIGDVIASFTGGYSDTSGATASWLFDDHITFTRTDVPDARITVDVSFYKRITIDPRLCGGLVISPNLNFFRALDAMSLTWNRSKLKIGRAH